MGVGSLDRCHAGDGGGIMFSCVIKHCSVISNVSSARGNGLAFENCSRTVSCLTAFAPPPPSSPPPPPPPPPPGGAFSNKILDFQYSF